MTTEYDVFKKKVEAKLAQHELGLTWTEIKQKLKLKQKVPYNRWVKALEKDIGLRRIKDSRGMVWTLRRRK
jgi:hypothetical protein